MDIDLKASLSIKIENWVARNYEGNAIEYKEELELVISAISNKELFQADLGGLVALRGFYYQYLVAVNYLVEMNYKKGWDILTFEILDDISLININDKIIRYVQVKTKREDHEVRTMSVSGDLVKRDKQLNSWMDKLLKSHDEADSVYSDYTAEYELAANDKVESKLDLYRLNKSFDVEEILDDDALFLAIKKKVKVNKTATLAWNNDKLLKKRLMKFRVMNYEKTELFRLHIIQRIASELVRNDVEVEFYKAIATYVIKELMHRLTIRTCDDSNKTENGDLVFTRDEVRTWINYGIEVGSREINDLNSRENKRAYFKGIFDELMIKFRSEWKTASSDILTKELSQIELAFVDADIEDPYFYNKFIARLFDFENNSNYYFSKDIDEKKRIILALEYLVMLHVFQRDNNLILDESNFVFKEGKDLESKSQNFSICDIKGKLNLNDSKQLIIMKAEQCKVSQRLNHNYYCIVNDFLRVSDRLNKIFGDNQSVPDITDKSREVPSLIDKIKNIKFIDGDEQLKVFISKVKERNELVNDELFCKNLMEYLKE